MTTQTISLQDAAVALAGRHEGTRSTGLAAILGGLKAMLRRVPVDAGLAESRSEALRRDIGLGAGPLDSGEAIRERVAVRFHCM